MQGFLRVALFIPSFGDGGVERGVVHTARGLVERGVSVDFITAHADKPYLEELPADVRLIELGGDATEPDSYRRFLEYLRDEPPHVLISGKDRAHATAIVARAETNAETKLVMRPGTLVSRRHRPTRFWRRWRAYRRMRCTYPQADLLITVSRGVARDTADITGISPDRIKPIESPIITPELFELAARPVTHLWLIDRRCPVLIAGGGLRRQKGFDDLLRAFAMARQSRPLRLIIIGEGRLRRPLERLASRLDITPDVDFAGFIANPYPLLAAADLFVLSSRWEGAPTIVTESVALGQKVVATECGSGPGEILAGNTYSTLVPVGDIKRMATAINTALDWPRPSADALRDTVRNYTLDVSAARYHAALAELVGRS